MPHPVRIDYLFRFDTGETIELPVRLDQDTLALIPETKPAPAFWSALTFHRCSVCPLDQGLHPHCPIALRLNGIVTAFGDHYSYDSVTVEVTDSHRRYVKGTSLQEGLGSLMGIVMVTGGCPVMNPLRPLVRFHLPFASIEETEFRIVAMYLIAQYFRDRNGRKPDWSLAGLQVIYDRVHEVNRSFADRLRAATTKDASVNAIVVLDCFARAVPFAVRTALRAYESHFKPYFR